MTRSRFYLALALAATVAMLLLLFLGPLDDATDEDQATLWDETWEKIEYEELRPFPESAAGGPSARDEDLMTITLVRVPGVARDEAYVIAPQGGRPGASNVRRRGNFNALNMFRDAKAPRLMGFFEATPERIKERELDDPYALIRFYDDPGGEPITMKVGRIVQNNNVCVTTDHPDHEGLILLAAPLLIRGFHKSYDQWRDRRLLYYPSDSYTKRVEMIGEATDGQPFVLNQKRRPGEEEFRPEITWELEHSEGETEIETSLANGMDALVKQLQIKYFWDEEEVSDFDARALWEESAQDYLRLRILVENGLTYDLRIRKPAQVVQAGTSELYLLNSGDGDHVDYIEAALVKSILAKRQGIVRSALRAVDFSTDREGAAADD